jgi:hypothetical protein
MPTSQNHHLTLASKRMKKSRCAHKDNWIETDLYFKPAWLIGLTVSLEDLRFLLRVQKLLKRPMKLHTLVELLACRKFEEFRT